jgi:DUF2892 family protein
MRPGALHSGPLAIPIQGGFDFHQRSISASRVYWSHKEVPDMTHNVGGTDRILRIFAGLVLLAIAIFRPGTGYDWVGWIGVVPLLTALIGWCPAYSLFGINSCGTSVKSV